MLPARLSFSASIFVFGLAALGVSALQPAAAQSYPTRPVTVVVPFPSGSGSDVIARLVFDFVSQKAGQQFVIDNRPAAGGVVGTRSVAVAPGDGYTLLFAASGPLAINKALMKSLPYDPENDFSPISKIAVQPNVFVVNTRVPVKTVKEFVEYAKNQPNTLNYSSIGLGSSSHLAAAHFAVATGLNMTHVPYKGMSQLVSDLLSGEVPITFTVFSNASVGIQAGSVRPLAVSATERLPNLPDVPTLAEAGFPGLETSAWFSVLGPRETPQPVVDFLNQAINEALANEKVRNRFKDLGAVPDGSTPDGLKMTISAEVAKWRKVSEQTGIKID